MRVVEWDSQYWPSSTIEAARKRPNKPSNMTVNQSTGASKKIMRVSKMEYDFEPMSLDALFWLHDVVTSGRADTAALIAKFQAQQQRTQRLKDYCDQIFAEMIHVS
jgi:hypothetical protein